MRSMIPQTSSNCLNSLCKQVLLFAHKTVNFILTKRNEAIWRHGTPYVNSIYSRLCSSNGNIFPRIILCLVSNASLSSCVHFLGPDPLLLTVDFFFYQVLETHDIL